MGQTFEYLAKHPGEAVKLGLDAIFAVSSIEKILSGKAGLMDYVDVLLTYGGAGAAVVAKLGVAAMKIAKVACVVGKASEAVSALSKTGKVMRTLKTIDKIGNAVIKPIEKVKPLVEAAKGTKVVSTINDVRATIQSVKAATFAGAKMAGKTFVSGVGDLAKTANSAERVVLKTALEGGKATLSGVKEAKSVFQAEKTIRKVESGKIPLTTNLQKGNYGEMKMDQIMRQRGYDRISTDRRVTGINDKIMGFIKRVIPLSM